MLDGEPLFPPAWEADTNEQKSTGALHAALGRICKPKPGSGKLEVSPEIHKQWAAGGKSRKALLEILVKFNGDKEPKWLKIWNHDPDTYFNKIVIFIQRYCFLNPCMHVYDLSV